MLAGEEGEIVILHLEQNFLDCHATLPPVTYFSYCYLSFLLSKWITQLLRTVIHQAGLQSLLEITKRSCCFGYYMDQFPK